MDVCGVTSNQQEKEEQQVLMNNRYNRSNIMKTNGDEQFKWSHNEDAEI